MNISIFFILYLQSRWGVLMTKILQWVFLCVRPSKNAAE